MNPRLLVYFAIISTFLAFAYNTILYFLNYSANLMGFNISARINFFLLGSKEVLILGLGILLLFQKKRLYAVFGVLGLLFTYVTCQADGIKTLFNPALILIVFYLGKDILISWFSYSKNTILKVLGSILIFALLIAYSDYSFRRQNNVDSENWYKYEYLQANNKYRCAKILIDPSIPHSVYEDCITTRLNFYKLMVNSAGEYKAIQALFLPIGDSVVFASLLLYFLIFYLVCSLPKEIPSTSALKANLFFALITSSLFLTFNRVNSIFAILVIISLFLLQLYSRNFKKSGTYVLLVPILVYLINADYLVMSIFEPLTPSNLGHQINFNTFVEPVSQATTVGLRAYFNEFLKLFDWLKYFLLFLPILILYRRKLFFHLAGYVGVTLTYVFSAWHFEIPILLAPPKFSSTPLESDFFKALIFQGALGVTIHALILGTIAGELLNLLVIVLKRKAGAETLFKAALFCILSLQFLAYQFLAPYFISGYVIFGSFFGVWFLLLMNLQKELPKGA